MKKKNLYLLLIFLCFYIFIGYSFKEFLLKNNIFFGGDTERVIDDIVIFNSNHYRTKVHPLFVILINPFGVLLNYFIKNKIIVAIVLNGFFGSISAIFIKKYLELSNIKSYLKYMVLCLYLFSMTTLIFSSIPESFIFGAFFLIYAHYLFKEIIIKINMNEYDNNFKYLLKFFMISMIFCFGMTITNYIPTVILLAGILIKSNLEQINRLFFKNIKLNKVRYFLSIIILTLFVGTIGTITQKTIYKSSGLYFTKEIAGELDYIVVGDKSIFTKMREIILENEELKVKIENLYGQKFNVEKNIEKLKIGDLENSISSQIKNVFINFTLYDLISTNPKKNKNGEIFFDLNLYKEYNFLEKTVMYIWGIIIIGNIILTILKKIYINYFIIACIAFNILLHCMYGANESFLYSAHVFFLFIILLANVLEKINKNKVIYNLYKISLLYLVPIIIYTNMNTLVKMKELLIN